MTLKRVLITGGGGQLASDLEAALSGTAEVRAPSHAELDITDEEALAREIAALEPDLVFNSAAFHNVDLCEDEPDRALAVNMTAVARLAARCAEAGAKLVHLSTNYVFDGRGDRPYVEEDMPNPRSIYAISKLAGEYGAFSYSPGALVVRTAGLYGTRGSEAKGGNFVTRLLARARGGEQIRMVADQRLNPTFTPDLAAAMLEAVALDAEGVLHLTNLGECSWYEFAETILEVAGIEAAIEPVTKGDGPGKADRPLNGVLASSRAEALGLSPPRDWRVALEDYLRQPAAQPG